MKRPKQHQTPYGHVIHNNPIDYWIRKLRELKMIPQIIILEDLGSSIDKQQANSILNEAEIRWIKTKRDEGIKLLNCTDGGGGMVGHEISDEHREKLRAWRRSRGPHWSGNLGKKASPEASQNMRYAQAKRAGRIAADGSIIPKVKPEPKIYDRFGEKNSFYGKKHSPEFIAKMTGRKVSSETCEKIRKAKQKRVKCLDDGNVFECVKDASQHYNISEAAIAACARGARVSGTAMGKRFAYED